MAERNIQKTNDGVLRWDGLAAGDTGAPVRLAKRAGTVAAAQMIGTFGGTVTMQGSADGVNWFPLKDAQGNNVALTAAGLVDFSTAAIWLRPAAAAGVSDVDVLLSLGS